MAPGWLHRVEIKQIDFAPSQMTGIHLHPCSMVRYIVEGTMRFQVDGEPAKMLRRGDAFFEPTNTKILDFDNASDHESVTFIAFYLMEDSEQELIRMLK